MVLVALELGPIRATFKLVLRGSVSVCVCVCVCVCVRICEGGGGLCINIFGCGHTHDSEMECVR